MSTLPESKVRALRDIVFGHDTSDRNWEGCRQHWMQPGETAWLMEKAKSMTKKLGGGQ